MRVIEIRDARCLACKSQIDISANPVEGWLGGCNLRRLGQGTYAVEGNMFKLMTIAITVSEVLLRLLTGRSVVQAETSTLLEFVETEGSLVPKK